MQSNESIESLEQKSNTTRCRFLIALAVFLPGIVICNVLVVLWRDPAPDAAAGLVRGLVYFPLAIVVLASALTGIWLFALYVFKYAPQINRARFDLQTSMMGDLQQQVKQLHENMQSVKD